MKTERKGKRSRILGVVAALIGLSICLVAIGITSIYALNLAPNGIPASSLFIVERGSTGSIVAGHLEAQGFIRSSAFFKFALKVSGPVSRIKSGTYRIPKGSSVFSILALLSSGKQASLKVTVPEGYTLRQISQLLESSGVCPAKDFIAAASDKAFLDSRKISLPTAEGYLFPDTYDFPINGEAGAVAAKMVDAFRAAIGREIPEAAGISEKDFNRNLIIASIIEREYRQESEAPLMASVFFNRLRIHMMLGSCATVVYVITEIQGKPHPSVVYYKDLAIQNDYNTYIHYGLPPGPISNPGMTALKAAFNPAKTDYLYFTLVDPETGSHHFSKNLEEHNKAGQLIIKAISSKK